ncbi:MAG: DMT family transporter [Thermoanaerobaculaceae bacterium]|nr:DMT family transporter [Thermoanaerobaculaceae bacterium]
MPSAPPAGLSSARGYAIALASAAVLSTTAIFIRHLTQTYRMPALVLAFWRDGLVFLTLLAVLAAARPALLPVARRHLPYLAGYGLMLATFNAAWTLSVALNGAALSTVLVYSSAAFTALLGRWLLDEPLGWGKLVAVTVSLAGCAVVSGALDPAAWRTNLTGITTGVLSGLCYAGYSLMGRSASQRGLDPWTTVLYTFGVAALVLLAVDLLAGGVVPGAAPRPRDLLWLGDAAAGWAALFLLAAGPTLAGFGLYNVSLGLLPSSVANLIVTLEVPFTAVIAYAVLGERLTAVQLAGGALVVAGVVLLRLYERWRAGRDPGRPAVGTEAVPPG